MKEKHTLFPLQLEPRGGKKKLKIQIKTQNKDKKNYEFKIKNKDKNLLYFVVTLFFLLKKAICCMFVSYPTVTLPGDHSSRPLLPSWLAFAV